MTQYQVTMTAEQAHVFERALDLYTRIGIGQLKIIEEHLRYFGFNTDGVEDYLIAIKKIIGIPANGNWGIGNRNVKETTHIAADMQKAIQKAIATTEKHADYSVWHDGVGIRYSKEPVMNVKVMEGLK